MSNENYYCLGLNFKTPNTPVIPEFIPAIVKEINKMGIVSIKSDIGWIGCIDLGTLKWNNWKEDMLLLSSKFPDILFTLDCNGDDIEEWFKAYFRDGKMQVCEAEVTYPNYDPKKMQKFHIARKRYSYQKDSTSAQAEENKPRIIHSNGEYSMVEIVE